MNWTKLAGVVGCLGSLPAAASAQGVPAASNYPMFPPGAAAYPAYAPAAQAYPVYPTAPTGYTAGMQNAWFQPRQGVAYPYPSGPVLPPRPYCLPPDFTEGNPPAPTAPPLPGAMPSMTPPGLDESAPPDESSPEAGAPAAVHFVPQMFGDSIGTFAPTTLIIRSSLSDATVANYGTTTDVAAIRYPLLSRGAYEISENESPRPMNRVFVNFNYYSDVPVMVGPPTSTLTLSPQVAAVSVFGPGPFPLRQTLASTVEAPTAAPGSPATLSPLTTLTDIHARSLGVYSETFGFEKTIGDNISIGLRVPLIQTGHAVSATVDSQRALAFEPAIVGNNGVVTAISDGLDSAQLGDLSVVLKWVLACDPDTGDLWSAGVVVTAPTAPSFQPAGGGSAFNPGLLQPWVGLIRDSDNFYVQGFMAVVVPSDFRDAIVVFNDIGVGYRLYQCSGDHHWLTGVTPTVEAHVNSPVTHRGLNAGFIGVPEQADVTGGVHLDFGCARFSVGAAFPVTGPHVFNTEIVAQLNLSF